PCPIVCCIRVLLSSYCRFSSRDFLWFMRRKAVPKIKFYFPRGERWENEGSSTDSSVLFESSSVPGCKVLEEFSLLLSYFLVIRRDFPLSRLYSFTPTASLMWLH